MRQRGDLVHGQRVAATGRMRRRPTSGPSSATLRGPFHYEGTTSPRRHRNADINSFMYPTPESVKRLAARAAGNAADSLRVRARHG